MMNLKDQAEAELMQSYWDRREQAVAMRERGATYLQIGEHLGVTRERARQMVMMQQRILRWGRKPPLRLWQEQQSRKTYRDWLTVGGKSERLLREG